MSALFRSVTSHEYVPLDAAASNWSERSTIRGLAVSSLLAHECESLLEAQDSGGFVPARWTVDLSRATAMSACSVSARLVHSGRRVNVIDSELTQRGRITARARGVFVRGSSGSDDAAWRAQHDLPLPPAGMEPHSRERRLYWSTRVGWTSDAAPHQNSDRKQIWQYPITVVEACEPSPFELVAAAADLASVVTHWGALGLAHVNIDLSVNLTRLPADISSGVGLMALERIAAGATAVGAAVMRDTTGKFGLVSVTAIENAQGALDPNRRD